MFVEKSIDEKSKSFTQKDTFDGSRKDINAAIDQICEFTGTRYGFLDDVKFLEKLDHLLIYQLFIAGTKIIFWDLREPFINNLYKPSVSLSRFEAVYEPLDTVRFIPFGSYILFFVVVKAA